MHILLTEWISRFNLSLQVFIRAISGAWVCQAEQWELNLGWISFVWLDYKLCINDFYLLNSVLMWIRFQFRNIN